MGAALPPFGGEPVSLEKLPTIGSRWIERGYNREIEVIGYKRNRVQIQTVGVNRTTTARPDRFGRGYRRKGDVEPAKPCACGGTPTAFDTHLTQGTKWVQIWPNCCGEWSIEARTGYQDDPTILQAIALEAWNRAPRAHPTQGDQR